MKHNCYAFAHAQMCRFKNFVVLISLLLFSVENSYSQDSTKPLYAGLAYIKVKPGKDAAYRDLVKNYSKKAFQSQVNEGAILGWYLEQVLIPSGSNEEYDYVTVTVTMNLKSLLDPNMTFRQIIKKVFPSFDDKKIDELLQQYADTRSIVKREIYTTYTYISGPSTTPTKYNWITYQQPKPGKLAETEKWEKDNWTSIHKAAIELGGMSDWGVYTLMMPYNVESKYSYVTVNGFDQISQLENDFKYNDAIKKAAPNMDFNKIFQLPGGDKTPYKIELQKLIDYVNTATK